MEIGFDPGSNSICFVVEDMSSEKNSLLLWFLQVTTLTASFLLVNNSVVRIFLYVSHSLSVVL